MELICKVHLCKSYHYTTKSFILQASCHDFFHELFIRAPFEPHLFALLEAVRNGLSHALHALAVIAGALKREIELSQKHHPCAFTTLLERHLYASCKGFAHLRASARALAYLK